MKKPVILVRSSGDVGCSGIGGPEASSQERRLRGALRRAGVSLRGATVFHAVGPRSDEVTRAMRMLSDGAASALAVSSLSRLSRYPAALDTLRAFLDSGGRLITLDAGEIKPATLETCMAWALLPSLLGPHRRYRRSRRRMAKGSVRRPRAPFGYRVRLEPNPQESEVVRTIFARFASGSSMKAIAEELNRAGVAGPPAPVFTFARNRARGPDGTQCWTALNVSKVIREPRYGPRADEPSEQLVDDGTWQAVQQRLATSVPQTTSGPQQPKGD